MMPSNIYTNDAGIPISRAAWAALTGARMVRQVGFYAASRWTINNGSSLRLLTLARQLIAVQAATELMQHESNRSKK